MSERDCPDDMAVLRADRDERIKRSRLGAHPDCSDPAHRGCSLCRDQPSDGLNTEEAAELANVLPSKVQEEVAAGAVAPRWWKCDTHGPAKAGAWGCPDCVREMRDEAASFHMAYRMKCDEETKAQAEEIERLRATLAALVAAHDTLQQRNFQGGPADYEQQRDALRAAWKAAKECISA